VAPGQSYSGIAIALIADRFWLQQTACNAISHVDIAYWTKDPERLKSISFNPRTDWYKCPTNMPERQHSKMASGKKSNSFNINDVTT
jgi:hypothetical protein